MSTASPTTVSEDPQVAKYRLELEYLRRQIEKLSFEIGELQGESQIERRVKRYVPLISALLAVAAFWFGIVQYIRADAASREQRREADNARLDQQKAADEVFRRELKRETAKPLWDKQLALYLEAVENAAVIATTKDVAKRAAAEARFWVLYWGPLAAVEDVGLLKPKATEVEAAMVRFGKELHKNYNDRDSDQMQNLTLDLAHSVRAAVAPSFDVEAGDLQNLRPTKSEP